MVAMGSFFKWFFGVSDHQKIFRFIKSDTKIGPLTMKAPNTNQQWFWERMEAASRKMVAAKGPEWWRKRVWFCKLPVGVVLILVLWLVPGLFLIGWGVYGTQHRIVEQANLIRAERQARKARKQALPSVPATVAPAQQEGKP